MFKPKRIIGTIYDKEECDMDFGIGCITDYYVQIKEKESNKIFLVNNKYLFDLIETRIPVSSDMG